MPIRSLTTSAKSATRLLVAGSAVLSLAALGGPALAAALCVNPEGTHGCSTTISAAVSAAPAGAVINVSPGVYNEDVVITKSLSLISTVPLAAVINANGQANGIWVDGMAAAPAPGVANVVISGFKVRNAKYEGILLTNATNVTLVGNQVAYNDASLSSGTCPGIPAFETNEAADCGEGIHLMAVDHSTILDNEVVDNAGGILTSDETGPSVHNLISHNFVHDNSYDCGITLASHAPVANLATSPFGVGYNTISHNVSMRNGTITPGAGVGIFAPAPGNTNIGNVVIDNDLIDNGATGVAMHNHASAPNAPGDLNDNVIVGNHFSGNGADNAGAPTSGPTGINISTQAPITGTVVSQNTFNNEAVDVQFSAPAGQLNAHFNNFFGGAVININTINNMPSTATVDATENWWKCASGPNERRCATTQGSGISVNPWLTAPYENDSENSQR